MCHGAEEDPRERVHRARTTGSGVPCLGTPQDMRGRAMLCGGGMLAELFRAGMAARLLQLTHGTSGPGWLPSGMKPPPSRQHWAGLRPGQAVGRATDYNITPKKEQLPAGRSAPRLRAIHLPSLSSAPGDAPAPSSMRGPGCSSGMAGSGCGDVLRQWGPAAGCALTAGLSQGLEGSRLRSPLPGQVSSSQRHYQHCFPTQACIVG